MRRRTFVASLACAGWARGAQGQPRPVVGFLRSTPAAGFERLPAAFRDGLREMGFVEGDSVLVEYRFAEDQPERLHEQARDLVGRSVAIIVGDSLAIMAARAAPATMPLVFATGGDPVENGLVPSLNRPGGNITGVMFFGGELGPKRLELLRQVMPHGTIAVLTIPNNPTSEAERREIEGAEPDIGQRLLMLGAANDQDLATAFRAILDERAGALLVGAGTFLNSRREAIAAFTARHRMPSIYSQREGALAGGLMSYGTSTADAYRQVGIYAGRILKGERPGDLPVVQNARFEFVVNAGVE